MFNNDQAKTIQNLLPESNTVLIRSIQGRIFFKSILWRQFKLTQKYEFCDMSFESIESSNETAGKARSFLTEEIANNETIFHEGQNIMLQEAIV